MKSDRIEAYLVNDGRLWLRYPVTREIIIVDDVREIRKRRKDMEQVKIEDAAKELGLTPVCLRELLIRGLIPIGYAYQRDGCKRRKFIVSRELLNQYKTTLKGGET